MLKADGIDAGSAKGRTNEMVKNLKESGEGLNEPGEVGEETGDVQNDPCEGGGSRVGDTASAKNAYTASGDLKNVYTASINTAYTIRAENVCDHTARNNAHRTKGDAFIDPVVAHNAKNGLKIGDTAKVDIPKVQTARINIQQTATARVMMDNDYTGKHVGKFASSKK
ncbi:hypothetical protein QVD17_16638 [Tagetes erecta]|uniref:Uncharacterized protein n=1 Tax=Tagetes erecta TaxID=13708 RepID=A0AAD8NZR7_TARER|nr:hypothetical protein QVD17_16638 [Tagetes erecta]